jgi:hypothetical protein
MSSRGLCFDLHAVGDQKGTLRARNRTLLRVRRVCDCGERANALVFTQEAATSLPEDAGRVG